MQNLNDLSAPILKALAKMTADAMKGRREELGQTKGEFAVDQTVVLSVKGTVKVAKSTPDALKPQSAKPWSLVATLLTELNKERAAAGKAGIDMTRVVEMAEALDPTLADQAKNEADAEIARIKEPTRGLKWGGVSVKGTAEVLASECNLPEDGDGWGGCTG